MLELTFKVVMGSSIEKVSFLALSKIGFGSTLGYFFSDSGHFWVSNKNQAFSKGSVFVGIQYHHYFRDDSELRCLF